MGPISVLKPEESDPMIVLTEDHLPVPSVDSPIGGTPKGKASNTDIEAIGDKLVAEVSPIDESQPKELEQGVIDSAEVNVESPKVDVADSPKFEVVTIGITPARSSDNSSEAICVVEAPSADVSGIESSPDDRQEIQHKEDVGGHAKSPSEAEVGNVSEISVKS